MYNVHLLALVLARTDPRSYLALPPSPREIMRKGVAMRVARCVDFVMTAKDRRNFRRERA